MGSQTITADGTNTTSSVSGIKKRRILYYDVLNILATLGVVFLHCNGNAHVYSNTLGWYQALAVEVFVYWSVPIFFMLSGATLMGYRKRYTTKEFFKKRFIRTVVPFVVWTLIGALDKEINPFKIGFREFINRCFGTSIENVYWFFIPLFAIYLAMPGISLLKNYRSTLWYLAGSAFVLNSLLPPIFKYIGLRWNSGLTVPMVSGYLVFSIFGYLFATENFSRKKRIVIYALGIFGALLRYGMTVYLSIRDGVINKTFFSYTEYYSVFLAVAVFVFVKNSKFVKSFELNQNIADIVSRISGCSFGVYLMHMFIIRFLREVLPESLLGVEWRVFAPLVIYAIALSLTFILKKLPVLRHIVP